MFIPRLNSRGPIEARKERKEESHSWYIPRLNSRGPIEAPSCWFAWLVSAEHSAAEQPRPH